MEFCTVTVVRKQQIVTDMVENSEPGVAIDIFLLYNIMVSCKRKNRAPEHHVCCVL